MVKDFVDYNVENFCQKILSSLELKAGLSYCSNFCQAKLSPNCVRKNIFVGSVGISK